MLDQWYWVLPNEVLFSKELSDKQKLLFCLISSLCAEKWFCWATNKFLWEKLGVWEWTISNCIKVLNELWFIQIDTENSQRKISLVKNHKGYVKNHKGGMWKITNIIIQENNISSYEDIYTGYYWKRKWVDEKACNKLIDNILNQWTTLEEIKQCMVLYNCECRLKQEYRYVKKLETRLKEFQTLNEEEIESWISEIARNYKSKLTDPKFQNSKIAKDTWAELTGTFGEEKIREIRKREWRKQINLSLT